LPDIDRQKRSRLKVELKFLSTGLKVCSIFRCNLLHIRWRTHTLTGTKPIATLRIPLHNAVGNVYCQDAEEGATATRKYAPQHPQLETPQLQNQPRLSHGTKNSIELIFKCALPAEASIICRFYTWHMANVSEKCSSPGSWRKRSHAYRGIFQESAKSQF